MSDKIFEATGLEEHTEPESAQSPEDTGREFKGMIFNQKDIERGLENAENAIITLIEDIEDGRLNSDREHVASRLRHLINQYETAITGSITYMERLAEEMDNRNRAISDGVANLHSREVLIKLNMRDEAEQQKVSDFIVKLISNLNNYAAILEPYLKVGDQVETESGEFVTVTAEDATVRLDEVYQEIETEVAQVAKAVLDANHLLLAARNNYVQAAKSEESESRLAELCDEIQEAIMARDIALNNWESLIATEREKLKKKIERVRGAISQDLGAILGGDGDEESIN